ncbi:DUF7671 family protein [Leuconostoc miyukkimchii]|uniref:DUF7671 family protein n=1 Tax=Leuconostoc miyukkimchii TaxID=910540 RepID=UPI001C7CB615|nr:hypothetical protein [Leuconostoc miyukkimchii]
MSDSKKYNTYLYTGIMVEQDASGHYQPKPHAKPNYWRTGKHTKGQFTGIGQIFLTEKNQPIAALSIEKLPFSQRHNYSPLQRWTTEKINTELLELWL